MRRLTVFQHSNVRFSCRHVLRRLRRFYIKFAAFDSDDQHRNLQRNRMELLCTNDKAMKIAMEAIPTTTSQPDEDHEADNEHLHEDYKLDIVNSRGTLGPPLVLTA